MSRVLVASYSVVPAPNDEGVYIDQLLAALGSRYEVDAMTVRGGELPHVQRYRSVRMLRVPVGDGGSVSGEKARCQTFRRALRRQLEGNDYDVIHACGLEAWWAVRGARAAETKLVFDPQSPVDRASAQQLQLKQASLILAHSVAGRLAIRTAVPDARTALVWPGVDVDLFDWEQVPMPGVPRLVYHGAVAPGCGVRLLVSAMPRVLARHRARLWIVGPGEPAFFAELRELAFRLGVADRVEFFGAVEHSQLPRLLAVCTVGAVPAVRGGAACPRKALELAACRRAIVAAAHPALEEVFAPGTDVLTFTPGDAAALGDAVLAVLADATLRERLADAAYRRVREGHGASAMRRAVLSAYRGLAPPLPLPKGPQTPDTAAQTLEAIAVSTPDSLATIPDLRVPPLGRDT